MAYALSGLVVLVASVLVVFIWHVFLPTREHLTESLYYSIKPNWLSLFHGEYWRDRDATSQLFCPVALTGLIGWLVYAAVCTLFGRPF